MSKAWRSISALLLWLIFGAIGQAATSLEEAIEETRLATSGKILGAETIRQKKMPMYRIKVLTPDGQVRVVLVAAQENEHNPTTVRSKKRVGKNP
jgi:uncharacterized membrane protein YkoI